MNVNRMYMHYVVIVYHKSSPVALRDSKVSIISTLQNLGTIACTFMSTVNLVGKYGKECSHWVIWFVKVADSFMNEVINCFNEQIIESFIQLFKTTDSFSNKAQLSVAQRCKTVPLWLCLELFSSPK